MNSDPSSGGMSNYTIKVIRMSPLIVIKVVMVIGIIDPKYYCDQGDL